MKTITYTQYGPPEVLEFKEIEPPTPKDNEVLVKVYAASLNQYDWHLLTADIFLVRLHAGLFKPKRTMLGPDIAGRVEAVGSLVEQFRPGDEVYGDISACGGGGFAEYVCVPETALVIKPSNLSFEEAAAVPMAAVTALQGLRDKGQIKPGQKVLINGASGGVGSFAVQLAKVFGAEVTAVCSSRNAEQARSLGADHVIDYTKQDFTQSGKQYDLILGVNGYQPLSAYKRALTLQGRYVMIGGSQAQMFQALLFGALMSRGGQKMRVLTAKPNQQDLFFIKDLLEEGKVVPILDRRFAFAEMVEAMRYLGSGHARGKVVITVAKPSTLAQPKLLHDAVKSGH